MGKEKRILKLGQTVVTRAVSDKMDQDFAFSKFCEFCLARHQTCDWGDLSPDDRQNNEDALKNGDYRFMSVYEYPGKKELVIWIITEWDHSATTILFPSDY